MRILILHNAYQQVGGEDTVVAAESNLLKEAGHDVFVDIVTNDVIQGVRGKVSVVAGAGWNRTAAASIAARVSQLKPDIVHIHNFFPLYSPAIHGAARKGGAAVVQTLHNYRLMCAAATLLRDGNVCTDCLDGSRMSAIRHRCYRGSLIGSAGLVRMQRIAERRGVWSQDVDCFVALTHFARRLFVKVGLPKDRIRVKPNFVDRSDAPHFAAEPSSETALFVGRLSHEKGVLDLAHAWQDVRGIALKVLGDGPEAAEMKALAPSNVTFMGRLQRADVLKEMAASKFLVFPSRWYEGFPMIFIEAMAAGLPIAASKLGAAEEVLKPSFGSFFNPGDPSSLAAAVRAWTGVDLSDMRRASRATYEAQYTERQNIAQLETCYEAALIRRHSE